MLTTDTSCFPFAIAVHLDHYRSESDFRRLYDEKYAILFHKAARFLSATSATAESTLVLISAGFDACAYEYPGMQRHGKHVPPSFYHTFARDAVRFAESHAGGKLVSVLEGGYSDRALCSAALAHVTGLATSDGAASASTTGAAGGEGEAEYWKLENLIAVEKVAKKMAAHAAAAESGGVGSTNTTPKRRQAELVPWLALTSKVFAAFEQACGKSNVVALGATATPLRGAAAAASARAGGAASAINSPANLAAGRVLRDRAPLKTRQGAFDSATSTPQARRAASPTKTPTRTAGRRDSPSKARTTGNPFVTPAKSESRPEDGDVSMAVDGETPTRGAAGEEVSTPPLPEPPQAESKHVVVDTNPIVPNVPPLAPDAVPTTPLPPPSVPTTTNSITSPKPGTTFTTSAFIPTSSPAFSPVPLTLVDAMSPPSRRIVDVNTDAIVTSDVDPLGLEFLRKQSFQFANGSPAVAAVKKEFDEGEEDAPGSPDLGIVGGGKESYEGYFPVMPGGLGDADNASLTRGELSGDQQQGVAQKDGSSTSVGSSLYPHLPKSFPHTHTQPSQQ
ncbi:likely histone deacetylase [Pseudozyma hubeiensis SY62]|uniref:Likely histone deacetylase n=1 Tax=Pseudozyma hubeiensis (strain SY62) TaxID=1305764 RepID=R9P0T1_PSEHS|nr:likely histone deacetylase [Pseudozyma hubeiensis SY62]GAC94687.1 likely histone deacetylase [Pseudozyma hubeiensis SY62]